MNPSRPEWCRFASMKRPSAFHGDSVGKVFYVHHLELLLFLKSFRLGNSIGTKFLIKGKTQTVTMVVHGKSVITSGLRDRRQSVPFT